MSRHAGGVETDAGILAVGDGMVYVCDIECSFAGVVNAEEENINQTTCSYASTSLRLTSSGASTPASSALGSSRLVDA